MKLYAQYRSKSISLRRTLAAGLLSPSSGASQSQTAILSDWRWGQHRPGPPGLTALCPSLSAPHPLPEQGSVLSAWEDEASILQGTNTTRKPCSLYYYLPTKRKTNVVVRNTTPERKLSRKLRLGEGGVCGAQRACSPPRPTPQTRWEKWYPGQQLPAAAASIHVCQWESELGGCPAGTGCGALSPSPALLLLRQLILQCAHPCAKRSSKPHRQAKPLAPVVSRHSPTSTEVEIAWKKYFRC